jgi:CheY-like chemotaxis protein
MKRILIVDDDEFMAGIYRDNLDAHGFTTELAASGLDAMQRIKDIDGVQVLKYIHALEATSRLPVIVLSNAYMNDTVKAAQREGAARYLAKSVCTPKDLVKEVEGVLAKLEPKPAPLPYREPSATSATIAQAGIRDPDQFQTEFRYNVTGKLAERVKALRQLLHAAIKAGREEQIGLAIKLYRAAHSVTGMAGLSGLKQMAHMSSALELLLMDVQRAPVRLNQSCFRTMAQAIDIISLLQERAVQPGDRPALSPLILVVDDEPIARESICSALENVYLRAVSLGDAALAVQLLEETRFDLVFLDVEMPGQNGFEVCERIRKTPTNQETCVVFITAYDDFENRARSNLSGGNDFISKSASSYEIGVKTLSHLLKPAPSRPAAS